MCITERVIARSGQLPDRNEKGESMPCHCRNNSRSNGVRQKINDGQ
jgi:hypothetical protein